MPIFSATAKFFNDFFGWSSYLLVIGLIDFSIVHMAEGIQKKRLIRWSLVIGLLVLWLIMLAESRLIGGPKVGGVVATLLVIPFAGWSSPVIQVLLVGLFIVVSTVAFRIIFGHVLLLGRAFRKLIADDQSGQASGNGRGSSPSPYLGQRPRYSRYAANKNTPIPASPKRRSEELRQQVSRESRPNLGLGRRSTIFLIVVVVAIVLLILISIIVNHPF